MLVVSLIVILLQFASGLPAQSYQSAPYAPNTDRIEATFGHSQYQQIDVINDEIRLFTTRASCREACARACKGVLLDSSDTILFLCTQIKPPEKSIPEKLLTKLSLPIMLLIGVIGLFVLACLICCCRAICCQPRSRASHSSREGLHQRHVADITDDGAGLYPEKQPLPTASIEDSTSPLPSNGHSASNGRVLAQPSASFKSLRSTRVHNI
uniref:Apple domain-containing protein n=1 Tax=Panagrellus redivivus TaxID=6233 RepID=A0A7E4VL41_PANRE